MAASVESRSGSSVGSVWEGARVEGLRRSNLGFFDEWVDILSCSLWGAVVESLNDASSVSEEAGRLRWRAEPLIFVVHRRECIFVRNFQESRIQTSPKSPQDGNVISASVFHATYSS